MPVEVISAKAPKKDRSASIEFNFGADVKEMCSLFGEAVVLSAAKAQMTVGAQAAIRRLIEADVSDADIKERMKAYKPGVVSRVGGGKAITADAAVAYFENLSPEAQTEMMNKLQSKRAKK